MLGVYVDSPLHWGVHVVAGSSFDSFESLRGARFGISRYGSGSNLMAYAPGNCHCRPCACSAIVTAATTA